MVLIFIQFIYILRMRCFFVSSKRGSELFTGKNSRGSITLARYKKKHQIAVSPRKAAGKGRKEGWGDRGGVGREAGQYMAIFMSRNPYRMTKRIILFALHNFRPVILLTVVPSHWKGYKKI